jgi:O-methyltransferase
MDATALYQLVEDLKYELALRSRSATAAIIGRTPAALELVSVFTRIGAQHQLLGIYAEARSGESSSSNAEVRPLSQLQRDRPDLVLIASDENKEELILAALPYLTPHAKVLIGGFEHFRFRDPLFQREVESAIVPSLANGYPNCLIHIYQCLKNAARLNLAGVVAEFGMFKGGTTMLISRFIEQFGQNWKVFGFDTFDGFPAPRSPLDMYAHPDCVYRDLSAVRRLLEGRNVEIIAGDVVDTANVLADKDIVLAFIDTDNYTSANSVLDAISDRIVAGGAIIFDHFTGKDRFLYTLGERIAAKRLLNDARYFNLHETGVFLRIR